MAIDDKVPVGRHGIHADAVLRRPVGKLRQMCAAKIDHAPLIGPIDLAIDAKRIVDRRAAGMLGHLHAACVNLGESIKAIAQLRRDRLGPARLLGFRRRFAGRQIE